MCDFDDYIYYIAAFTFLTFSKTLILAFLHLRLKEIFIQGAAHGFQDV